MIETITMWDGRTQTHTLEPADTFAARVLAHTGVELHEMPDLPADAHLVPGPIVARRGRTTVYAVTDYPIGDGEPEVLGYVVDGRTDDLPAARVCPDVDCMGEVTVTTCDTCTDRRPRGVDYEDDAQADCEPGDGPRTRLDILRQEWAAAMGRWIRTRHISDGEEEQRALSRLLDAEAMADDLTVQTPPAQIRRAARMTEECARRFGVDAGDLLHYEIAQDDAGWTGGIWLAETGERIGCDAQVCDLIPV